MSKTSAKPKATDWARVKHEATADAPIAHNAVDGPYDPNDAAATFKAVAATLQTCVVCHSAYRQQIVDEAAWKKIMSHRRTIAP